MLSEDNSLPPDPQLAIREQSGIAVALSGKQIISLYKKSEQSNIPFDTLKEVYQRGYNESISEQVAFNRVNSFIAGGAAKNLDNDLHEAKIDRSAFIYLPPKTPESNFAQCGTCQHFMPGKQRCTLFGKNDVVIAEASCGLYAHGKPSDNQKIETAVTPKQAGYVVGEVRCENCLWFNKGQCGLFAMLKSKAPDVFNLNTTVDPKGCCNGWQKAMVTEETGLWANIHAKRERIKHGSGEHMRKPGSKGAPTPEALKKSQTKEAYTGAETVSKDSNDPSSRFIGTTQLTNIYKEQTPGQTVKTIKKVIKELTIRDAAGHKHQITKKPVREIDGKIHMEYPGKSSSSGGGGK